ncbi:MULTISPECIES: isochorismatase family protein [Rhodopseudomonas]|uniref:Amidohydrolase n=1 Tax=Rhodopseudomonas palustris TaxID=1076 RepID=A0A0D7EM44_RHOPL|nr:MULTISPECIES: isochorismatase family protein [Rhodopseudomonas]KIZ41899.1 amidohydrolase [Rhodopseudomonas palustris]MDF3812727.1 isochorismatase family protein [Rhodopseudomonas sp. BAL398]WOK15789.1 isochorismatase family protein [Rhodopseudomonas sp. BAL398]
MSQILSARPEPTDFDASTTALIVVDMQNGYCSPGGYFSHLGVDLTPTQEVIPAVARLVAVARGSGIQVVWLQNGWDSALKEAGGPHSVNQRKGNSLKLMRNRPDLAGTLLTKGGWDYELVKELKPEADDLVIPKPRYSGFAGTALDSMLRSRRIETLLVCGVATNVCVESTIRDAFFKEYFPILVRDACYQAGPDYIQQATIYNVEKFFGWSATVDDVAQALASRNAA